MVFKKRNKHVPTITRRNEQQDSFRKTIEVIILKFGEFE